MRSSPKRQRVADFKTAPTARIWQHDKVNRNNELGKSCGSVESIKFLDIGECDGKCD